MQKLKKSIAQVCAVVVLGATGGAMLAPVPAYALDCSILPKSICDNADNKDQDSGGIMQLLKWILRIMTGLVGIAAVGGIIYAGILYTSSSGDAGQAKKAKDIIVDVVIGILAYGLMFIALNWIIPGGVFSS